MSDKKAHAAEPTAAPLAGEAMSEEDRIRRRAYHLWEESGRPHGQDAEFWERARELEAIGANPTAGLKPADSLERPDEAALQDNLGEFPDRLSDQGERRAAPMTRAQERARTR